ncbi:MAG: FAD/NAD(P)-binding protein, partial [bacterium]
MKAEELLKKSNPYLPIPARIKRARIETTDHQIKSFWIEIENCERFEHLPGQFCQISIAGVGEAPFGIASSPKEPGLLFTVNRIGALTTALHSLDEGSLVGIRGPLGNHYPFELAKGRDVLIVAGGFAFTTLRSLFLFLSDNGNRQNYGKITILYGAREPGLLLYRDEFEKWQQIKDFKLVLTVDKGDELWKGEIGVVPEVLKRLKPESTNTIVFVCGPPIMLKYTFPVLDELGFDPTLVFTSLEMKMKCGIGKCGRCNIGHKYICKDGPVFSLE